MIEFEEIEQYLIFPYKIVLGINGIITKLIRVLWDQIEHEILWLYQQFLYIRYYHWIFRTVKVIFLSNLKQEILNS